MSAALGGSLRLMTRWVLGTAVLGLGFNLGGSALVRVSGHGGDRTEGSRLAWQIGGLMVYASIPILVGAVLFLVALVGVRLLLRATRST